MPGQQVEATKKYKNVTASVIVSGALRIKPQAILEIKPSKMSEGLKRLIGSALKEVTG